MKILKNIVIAFVAILVVDGFVYRDPYVSLPHGFSIVAISHSSPCSLQYTSWHDDRTYSDFRASRRMDSSTNKWTFSLVSDSEVIDFTTEAEWLLAIQKYNASPDDSSLQLENVQSFAADENHIIGTHGRGQFILDMQANVLMTYTDKVNWSSAVVRDTHLSAEALRNPRSLLVQSRDSFMIIGYVVLLLGAVVSGWPNRASRTKTA